MGNIYASMKSIASYVPSNCFKNSYFTSFLDTTDDWITARTGIKTRYFACKSESTSDLGFKAAKQAIKRAKLNASDIDIIICATLSPEYSSMPSSACLIAAKLGISVPAFDISSACSGFIYALSLAKAYVTSGAYKNVLVVGAEKISSILDFTDRSTCILFGDGAGACVVGVGDKNHQILDVHIDSDGSFSNLLYTPKAKNDSSYKNIESFLQDDNSVDLTQEAPVDKSCINMKGNEVFKVAVRTIANDAKEILEKNNLTSKDLAYFIPHQANLRIINSVASTLDISQDKIALSVHKYGNTSAASIPMAINDVYERGDLKRGDLILLDAFGGGFTWGSALVYIDF